MSFVEQLAARGWKSENDELVFADSSTTLRLRFGERPQLVLSDTADSANRVTIQMNGHADELAAWVLESQPELRFPIYENACRRLVERFSDTWVMDSWLRRGLAKSEMTAEELARRDDWLRALRLAQWDVSEIDEQNFAAGVAVSPDIRSQRADGLHLGFIGYFCCYAYAELSVATRAGERLVCVRVFRGPARQIIEAASALVASSVSAEDILSFVQRALEVAELCLLDGPDGWVALQRG